MGKGFDEYAPAYDAWFLENRNVLYSEINLVAHVLKNPGRTLSVGCGSGLFEMILAKEYGITVTDGIEPSEGMAEIARKRGMKVTISTAEEAATTTRFSSTAPPATSPIWKASSAKPTTPCPKAVGSS
jgi:ubiquinone/menaquinone biosynthesis C-methylase UbiE